MGTRPILVVPTARGVGLTSAITGLYHALDRQGIRTHYFKPVVQINERNKVKDYSRKILTPLCQSEIVDPIPAGLAEELISVGRIEELMENVLQLYHSTRENAEVILIEGMLENQFQPYANQINQGLAKALDADVVLVSSAGALSSEQLENQLEIALDTFNSANIKRVLGVIVNYTSAPLDERGLVLNSLERNPKGYGLSAEQVAELPVFKKDLGLLGVVPFSQEASFARTYDVAQFFEAKTLFEGELKERRISNVAVIARTVPNALSVFKPGFLLFSPADRDDVLMAATLAAASGVKLAGLVLTGPTEISTAVLDLCRPLIERSALPVLTIQKGTWETASELTKFNQNIPEDDEQRIQNSIEHFASHIHSDWIVNYLKTTPEIRLSPAAFRYQLVKRAKAANKVLVLPEGDEPRTVTAASLCADRGIARTILLADPESVKEVAKNQGVTLGEGVQIINPADIRDSYIERLIELRKHKGMNEVLAKEQLLDNVVLGTMMLESGEVDGLVSGAVHTTANTIRPPLQIIKTAPGASLVSSVFFMCLPEQVLVYGDCAINPNPTAEELADIAIQSADSGKSFGIDPKVAMISYSTGSSGAGEDVEKVAQATSIVREKRPDILIDGPLQYDAAAIASVAHKKAPDSPIAGKANIFIFPDLNTGNTTYKAVQRSANAISIGPMLQGMRKPVNDLSRGALIEDIVYTIAITAIQAEDKSA